MAISNSAIGSKPLAEADQVIISLVGVRPSLTERQDPPLPNGRMVGFYNASTGRVELYVASSGGTFWVRCS